MTLSVCSALYAQNLLPKNVVQPHSNVWRMCAIQGKACDCVGRLALVSLVLPCQYSICFTRNELSPVSMLTALRTCVM